MAATPPREGEPRLVVAAGRVSLPRAGPRLMVCTMPASTEHGSEPRPPVTWGPRHVSAAAVATGSRCSEARAWSAGFGTERPRGSRSGRLVQGPGCRDGLQVPPRPAEKGSLGSSRLALSSSRLRARHQGALRGRRGQGGSCRAEVGLGPRVLACERDVTPGHYKSAPATQPPPDRLRAQQPGYWTEGCPPPPAAWAPPERPHGAVSSTENVESDWTRGTVSPRMVPRSRSVGRFPPETLAMSRDTVVTPSWAGVALGIPQDSARIPAGDSPSHGSSADLSAPVSAVLRPRWVVGERRVGPSRPPWAQGRASGEGQGSSGSTTNTGSLRAGPGCGGSHRHRKTLAGAPGLTLPPCAQNCPRDRCLHLSSKGPCSQGSGPAPFWLPTCVVASPAAALSLGTCYRCHAS